jgi:hypothetical protein
MGTEPTTVPKRPPLPELPETGRHYLDNTQRARLASPGIERYAARGGRGGARAAVILAGAAIVAAMIWLAGS